MSVTTVTALEKIFKVLAKDRLTIYLGERSELLAWCPQKQDFSGWRWWKTFRTNALPMSTDFGTALANRGVPSFSRAEISRSTANVIMSVSCESIKASRGDDGAVVSEVDDAIAAASESMALHLDSMLAGDGGGSIGTIGSSTGAVITLGDASQIYLYQKGMKLQFSANDGTSTAHVLRDNGKALTVSSVDQAAGTVTCTANIATIAGIVNGDYIFPEGDFDAGAQRVLQGFFAHIPFSAPGSTAFFGVDRTDNIGALSGMRITGASANSVDTVKEAAALVKRNRGRADSLWVNPSKFTEIDQYATAKEFFQEKGDIGIGYSGIRIASVAGPIKVMASSAIPQGKGLLTLRESWLLRSLDGLPHPVDDDGRIWHLEDNGDSLQGRLRYYAQLGCLDPKHSCAITF